MKSKERVLLGMSGGTDSSVAAMRLQDAGYEVTGVTFRFYEKDGATEYLDDARALASRLGIEHITYDAREMFRSRIIRYFIDEYLAGHTPVPCTLCNNELKWTLLAKIADEKGIYWISTGHYVRKILQGGKYYWLCGRIEGYDRLFSCGLEAAISYRYAAYYGGHYNGGASCFAEARGFHGGGNNECRIGVCFCPRDYRSFLRREAGAKNCPISGNIHR